MAISEREQTALESIENALACSSPKLTSMLTIFTRLTAGEEMPARERVRRVIGGFGMVAGPAGRAGLCRIRRRHLSRAAWRWVWLLVAVAVLVLAVTLGRGAGKSTCAASGITACEQAPASPARQPGARGPGGL